MILSPLYNNDLVCTKFQDGHITSIYIAQALLLKLFVQASPNLYTNVFRLEKVNSKS